MNFEVNLTILIKPFFLHDQKKLLRLNKKPFFIIFKGLSIKQIKHSFLEGESPTLSKHNFSYQRL